MNKQKITNLCHEIRRFIGAFDVSTHLHARFLYCYRMGEGIPDAECSSYELAEMYSYELVVEGLDNTFYLNDEHVSNIKLLFLFEKLDSYLDTDLEAPSFWDENLMLFVE